MKPKEWEQFKELLRKNNPDKEIDFDSEFDKSLSYTENIGVAEGKKLKVEPPLSPLEKSLAVYYLPILQEAKKAAAKHQEKYREIAEELVPRIYKGMREAYENVNVKFDPMEARERIVRDLRGDWDKNTIIGLLPPEAKDAVKRKAGLESGRVRKIRTAQKKKVEVAVTEEIKADIIKQKGKKLALLEDIGDLKNIRIERVVIKEEKLTQEAEPMSITAQELADVIKEEHTKARKQKVVVKQNEGRPVQTR